MSNKINIRFTALLILLAVYNFFFWKEKLGVNLLIFTVLLIPAILLINPQCLKNRKVILISLAALFSAVMVVVSNSFFSKYSVFTCLMILAGYSQLPQLKSLFAAYSVYVVSFFLFPVAIIQGIQKSSEKNRIFRTVFNIIKLGLIPIGVLLVFYIIYAVSNDKFNFYSWSVIKDISDFIYNLLIDYPIVRFLFIILGFLMITAALYNYNLHHIGRFDNLFTDKLGRDKVLKLRWLNNGKKYVTGLKTFNYVFNKWNSLSKECSMGVIMLILVNMLIGFLNVIDIKFLWLNFDTSEIPVFSDYVYAGTYLLIFSIVLSMLILLYYFRGNLNFYRNNKTLKILSYVWIAQNGFMALSVWLRNYYYIIYTHTISYRKIGVIVFLLLTFFGLVTMIFKIKQKRTAYNIVKLNAWAVFAAMLLMSSFNWDKNIAHYNLANPKTNEIDIAYLLELSDDVLPALNENSWMMDRDFYIPRSRRYRMVYAQDYFIDRITRFKSEQENYSWLSWNYSDNAINEYLETHNISKEKKYKFDESFD